MATRLAFLPGRIPWTGTGLSQNNEYLGKPNQSQHTIMGLIIYDQCSYYKI